MPDPIATAQALLAAIASGDTGPSSAIHPERYIQHNLTAPDGRAGYLGLQQAVSSVPGAQIRGLRAFRDKDFVVTHTDYAVFGQRLAGFDVFRFEGDLVVEHWDNLQPLTDPRMTQGPVEVTDRDRTDANKALVADFVRSVLIGGGQGESFFAGDALIQHRAGLADGARTWLASPVGHQRLHRVLGEGNFVLTLSEGRDGGMAIFDLFRVEAGKIAEHWDTIAPIPPRETWKNPNGKF